MAYSHHITLCVARSISNHALGPTTAQGWLREAKNTDFGPFWAISVTFGVILA